MRALRFLPKEYAKLAIEKGILRMHLLSHYARTDDESIGDDTEGLSVGIANFTVTAKEPAHADLRRRASVAIHLGSEADHKTTFVGTRISNALPPHYVLCLSLDPNCTKWINDNPPKDYALVIRDVESLAVGIETHYPNLFGKPFSGAVRYTKKPPVELAYEDHAALNPFEKPPKFSDEAEFRILFPALKLPPDEYVDVEIPGMRDLFELRPRCAK